MPPPLPASFSDSPSHALIGARLERERRGLLLRCRDLLAAAEPAHVPAIEEAVNFLERQSCRVAVIGQVKAGKSSFINAFAGRPGLLPCDVNPWTAVVTNLHFFHADAMRESARFEFFDADEWRRIAESGGPLRELTERFVPGFDRSLLEAQLQSMRRRAEVRLGPQFASLLGQHHDFTALVPDLLGRYVSAGRDDFGAATSFSDITKSADIFFAGPRLGFPLTLVDTPGTNDPLLVRDEITRQCLSSADIYVVVLTAQQPLATGDLALLRLLRGLHRDRIVIFINRIDGLRDIASSVARVVSHVETQLRMEFPSTDFPIIVGSARWANCAQSGDAGAFARILDMPLCTYAADRGYGRLETATGEPRPSREARAAVFELSGLPAVAAAVDHLAGHSNPAHSIHQLATFFLQIAQSSLFAGRAELQSLARARSETGAGYHETQIAARAADLAQIERVAEELQANLTLFEDALRDVVHRCARDLNTLLVRRLAEFTELAVAELMRAYARNASAWSCDPRLLRDMLQTEFLRVYRFWEAQLIQVDRHMKQQLRSVLAKAAMEIGEPPPDSIEIPAGYLPSIAPLSRVVAMDLAGPWWKAWWYGRPALADRVSELRKLVTGEFEPLIGDLVQAALQSLEHRSRFATRQARIATLDIVRDIHRRNSELIANLQAAIAVPQNDSLVSLAERTQAAEARMQRWSELRAGFAEIVTAAETIVAQPPAAMIDVTGTNPA